jgi:hypothetical protein
MKAWTDHPLTFDLVGGKAPIKAPIREVQILNWDGGKYCVVKFEDGTTPIIKVCYIYQRPGRHGKAPMVKRSALRRLPRV